MTATTSTATISDTTLAGSSIGFLVSVEADLDREAAQARTMETYEAIKAQRDRVRAIRISKEYPCGHPGHRFGCTTITRSAR